jgi:hypothetical protein
MFDSRKLASLWGGVARSGCITSHSEWAALFDTWPLSMFTNRNTKLTARCFYGKFLLCQHVKKFPANVRYSIHNRVYEVPILSQINPVPTTMPYFGKTI